jgi:cytoskeleton protein RodZ
VSEDGAPVIESQPPPGPGATLRAAREAGGMTIAEAAAALKLSPWQIEAIENEDFSRLSGATFVRGFVRNYARLLKIDAAPVLDALAEQVKLPSELNAPVNEGVRMPVAGERRGRGVAVSIAFALLALIIALALYFDVFGLDSAGKHSSGRSSEPAPSAPETQTGAQAEPRAETQMETQAGTQAPLAPSSGAAVTAAPAAIPAAPIPPTPAAGMRRMTFSFSGASWVEVKDSAGRVIFSQNNVKGATQVVDGRPPLEVVIGNASQVRLEYKGQPVDLQPHTRVEVARLTLD